MKKRNIVLLQSLIVLFMASCATVQIAPVKEREINQVVETKISDKEAYSAAQVFLAKNLVDSNSAIKYKDDNTKRVVSQIRLTCETKVTNWCTFTKVYADFNIDFQAKPNKFRITFDDIKLYLDCPDARSPTQDQLIGPTDKKDLSEIDKKCLAPFREQFINSIIGKSVNERRDDF
jgi:hypothetical protein